MLLTIKTILAAVTFAFIVMASFDRCVGQEAAANRLGNNLLSDLRSNQIEANSGDLRAQQPLRATKLNSSPRFAIESPVAGLLPSSQQLGVSQHSTARRTHGFFDSDQPPPVVVVWLNSDLQTLLLSEGQLKQSMQSIPQRDSRTQQPEDNNWQTHSQSSVGLVSFEEQVAATPLESTSPESQTETFDKRLETLRKRFDSKTKQIAADESTDSAIKGEMSNLLGIAGDWIERAESGLKEFSDETAKAITFKEDLATQELKLAEEKKRATPNLFKRSDTLANIRTDGIEKLHKDLKEQETLLDDSMAKQSEVRKQISTREQRVTELPSLKRKNAEEADKTKRSLAELDGQPDDLNRSLQKLFFEAKFLSLEITDKSFELENRRQKQVSHILPLELEVLTLRIRRLKAEVAKLRTRSDQMRDRQLDERRLAARNALIEPLTQSTPQLKELAEFNIELVSQKKRMAVKSDELKKELLYVRQLQKELSESQEQIEIQIKTLGPTASGIRLIEHRRSLISSGKSQNRLLELADRLQDKQARKLLVEERLDALMLRDDFRLNVMAKVKDQVNDSVQQQVAIDVANHLLETEKEYAQDLVKMFKNNIQKLAQLEVEHKTLIKELQKAKEFSDKNALWVRSAKPIEINDLKRCRAGLQSLIACEQWQGLGDHTYQTFKNRPYDTGLLALVIGSLLVVRRRLRWSHE